MTMTARRSLTVSKGSARATDRATRAFGIEREVRAVDDVTLAVARNEIYGLAGESSCGKTHADQDDRRAPSARR